MIPLLGVVVFACGLAAPARAAADDDDVLTAPAAAANDAPLRPERVLAGDTNSDSAKVFRARGGPDRAVVHGGAVIINADGSRLEIAPTKRPAAEKLALVAPSTLAKKLELPALPTLDDPKAGLAERRRRAESLLGGTAAAALFLFYWARRRWRPDF